MDAQRPRPRVYVEPFAGGAGAALRLLYEEQVDRIVLNDLNPGIAAFWRAVFYHTAELVERVHTCELSIDAWHGYRQQYRSGEGLDVELGFATLYLNRTNRSGILEAGPIGGLQQAGRWKLDVRFNRQDLATRIKLLGAYRDRVEVHQQDALELLAALDTRDALLYVDPPYLLQGDELYMNTLDWTDHQRLGELLRRKHRRWMLTYDVDPRVPDVLYKRLRCAQFSIKHTAALQQLGTEYAVFSDSLRVKTLDRLSKGPVSWVNV
jgi:DNA adenine methylase